LIVRALVVSNMRPDDAHPERGRFVRDQVSALRALKDNEVALYEFPPGGAALARATVDLRRRFASGPGSARARTPHFASPPGSQRAHAPRLASPPGSPGTRAPRFDVVHAHFGLTAWPALAVPTRVRVLTVHGTDLHHPRTRLLTRAVLPLIDLPAAVSAPLLDELPGLHTRPHAQVLPCGVDLERFRSIPRVQARAELGLHPERPYLLFAADPSRPEKRHDLAQALARACEVELLALGAVDPAAVPLWVNAANAVLVPSDREGFGLAVLEALACEVPVLATPVGIHPQALAGVDGALCAPFDLSLWRAAVEPRLRASDPRLQGGRASASRFSATHMAERVADAWRDALERSVHRSG
jgi:teichuronic acid biosynthesis glycosyltransferase TuaC